MNPVLGDRSGMTSPGGTVTLKVAVKDTETASRSIRGVRDDVEQFATRTDRASRTAGDAFDRMDRMMSGALSRADRSVRDSTGEWERRVNQAGPGMASAAGGVGDQVEDAMRRAMQGVSVQVDRGMQDATQQIRGNASRVEQALNRAGQGGGSSFATGVGNGAQGGAQGAADGFLGKLKVAGLAGVAVVAAAVGAVFVDAFTEATSRRQSEAKAQARLGISPEDAKGLGRIAGQLYASGYGESVGEVTDQVATVKGSIKGLDDASLTKISGQAISFSNAFGTDVADSVQSVNTLLNSGLAPDAQTAFDLITRASQRVPESLAADVMEASNEYSQFFRTLGFSGEQAFDVLVKGSEKGTFGIDKAGDAIKEFTIRSTDMSKTSVDAYGVIGLDAQKTANDILAGGDTAQAATQKVIDGLLAIENPSTRANTAIALFGTQMEDLNVGDIPVFLRGLKGASGALGDTAGAASQMDSAMGSTVTGVELMWKGLKTKLVDFISDKVLPKLVEFADWAGEKLGPAMQVAGQWIEGTLVPALSAAWQWISEKLGPVVQDLADYITGDLIPAWGRFVDWWSTTGWPALEPILGFIKNSIENIVTVVRGVIDVLGGVLSGDWSRAWDGLKQIFSGFWDQIVNVASSAWGFIQGVITSIGPWIGQKLSEFGGFLQGKGFELISWIAQGIYYGAQAIWDWFAGLGGRIGAWINAQWEQITGYGGQVINWIQTGVVTGAVAVATWFLSLGNQIGSWVGGLVEEITGVGGSIISWITGGITGGATAIWDWISGGADKEGSLLNGLTKALDGIAEWIADLGGRVIGWIAGGITSAAQDVWDAITSVFERDPGETAQQQTSRQSGVDGLTGGSAGSNVPVGPTAQAKLDAQKGWTSGGGGSFGAGGGVAGNVLAGYEPGVDRIKAVLAPGESVMVPEWTRMVGAKNVYAMNRAARDGRYVPPNSFLGPELFAAGGVAGVQTAATALGADVAHKMADGIRAGKGQTEAAEAVSFGRSRTSLFDGLFRLGKSIASGMGGMGGGSSFDGAGGNWGPENMSGNAANTAAAIAYVQKAFGINDIGGWRASGSVAGSDHPKGKAIDVMIANYQSPAGIAKGTQVADFFRGNPAAFGTKYVIWRDRIDNMRGGGWEPYSHPGGNDDVLAHRNHVHVSFLTGPGNWSGQGVGDTKQSMGSLIGGLAGKLAQSVAGKFGFSGSSAGGAAPAPVQGGRWDPAVERWRPTVLQALALAGQPASLADTVLNQIRSESSGNPRAINLYDSNARKGTPSKGLIQTIDPTFQSYRLPQLANDPYDPLANIVAGIRYAVDRYGSLTAGMRGVAYENGGGLPPGFTMAWNGTGMDETVLPVRPKQMYDTMVGLASRPGSDGGVVIEAGAFAPGAIVINGSDLSKEEIEEMMMDGIVRVFRDDERRRLRR